MKKNVHRWILFGVLFVLSLLLGWEFAFCAWAAGGPPEPPDVKAYYLKWMNIYGILFLIAGLGAVVILILNVRWHLLRKHK
jgi:hypothetical protein